MRSHRMNVSLPPTDDGDSTVHLSASLLIVGSGVSDLSLRLRNGRSQLLKGKAV